MFLGIPKRAASPVSNSTVAIMMVSVRSPPRPGPASPPASRNVNRPGSTRSSNGTKGAVGPPETMSGRTSTASGSPNPGRKIRFFLGRASVVVVDFMVVVVSTVAGSGTRSASAFGGARVTDVRTPGSAETKTRSIRSTVRNPYPPMTMCGTTTTAIAAPRSRIDHHPVREAPGIR